MSDRTRADHREDISPLYPQNIFREVFQVPDMPETAEELAGLMGDRGALEIAMVLAGLSVREADILRYRYQKNRTLEELTEVFGIAKERIRQIEKKALRKMRMPAVEELLHKGVAVWLDDKIREEARRIANEEVPAQVHSLLTARLEWAEETMNEREAERMRLARDGATGNLVRGAELIMVEEMELSVRSYNCLKRAGCNTMADIIAMTPEQLLMVRNLGRRSRDEIIEKVHAMGFEMKATEDQKGGAAE